MKNKLPIFFIIVVCLSLVLTIFNLFGYFQPPQVLGAKTKIDNNLKYWEEIVSEYPTYQDGWLMVSLAASQEGNQELSKGAYETAKSINETSNSITKFNKLLAF